MLALFVSRGRARELLRKAEQLGFSFAGPRPEVKEPGKRGGRYYRTQKTGKVVYGQQPSGAPTLRPQESTPDNSWMTPEGKHADTHPAVVAARRALEEARSTIGRDNRWGDTRRFVGRRAGTQLDRIAQAEAQFRRAWDKAEAEYLRTQEKKETTSQKPAEREGQSFTREGVQYKTTLVEPKVQGPEPRAPGAQAGREYVLAPKGAAPGGDWPTVSEEAIRQKLRSEVGARGDEKIEDVTRDGVRYVHHDGMSKFYAWPELSMESVMGQVDKTYDAAQKHDREFVERDPVAYLVEHWGNDRREREAVGQIMGRLKGKGEKRFLAQVAALPRDQRQKVRLSLLGAKDPEAEKLGKKLRALEEAAEK